MDHFIILNHERMKKTLKTQMHQESEQMDEKNL